MHKKWIIFSIISISIVVSGISYVNAEESKPAGFTSPYAQWQRGLPHDPGFFPIAVWLQDPQNAAQYKQAGINVYIGLWDGPNQGQIDELKKQGMLVICDQNVYGIKHLVEPTIVGWMHGDEPDNAQDITSGWDDLKNATVEFIVNGNRFGRYGPPIPPSSIVSDYKKIAAIDPSRPVILNLGQGVAWDGYYGRGVRSRYPEDYPKYIRGCDIASFDIYPVVHPNQEVAGNLWYVAEGVKRLKNWTEGKMPVWNCIECTRIESKTAKPSPDDVRSEVWMSLIHGSMGLIYFVHEWVPKFDEAALLHNPEMLAAVTKINHRITELAPVLNSPSIENRVSVSVQPAETPIAVMMKENQQAIYLFTVAMRKVAGAATFTITGESGEKPIQVLDENRSLVLKNGSFQDQFKPYEVHLYRIGKSTEAGVKDSLKNN